MIGHQDHVEFARPSEACGKFEIRKGVPVFRKAFEALNAFDLPHMNAAAAVCDLHRPLRPVSLGGKAMLLWVEIHAPAGFVLGFQPIWAVPVMAALASLGHAVVAQDATGAAGLHLRPVRRNFSGFGRQLEPVGFTESIVWCAWMLALLP